MAEDLGDRTESPTERRLSDARTKGQVARSTDLSAAVTLIAVFLLVFMLAELMLSGGIVLLRRSLSEDVLASPGTGMLMPEAARIGAEAAAFTLPFMIIMLIVALASGIGQVGWHPSAEPLQPKWNKLNLVTNLKNLANTRAAVKGSLDLLKFIIIGSVVVWIVRDEFREIVALPNLELIPGLVHAAELAKRLAIWIIAVLILLAIIDFKYQRWQHQKDLRMTKQEVKDERRSTDGDPEVKSRRLRMARQIALQRLGVDVPKADVIVTNPTHFAVALRYDPASGMRAPRVIAKGADYLALKMRYLAALHSVPIVERPPLARALYAAVPVGKEIFPEHYTAVAEVLAYVYQLENRAAPAA